MEVTPAASGPDGGRLSTQGRGQGGGPGRCARAGGSGDHTRGVGARQGVTASGSGRGPLRVGGAASRAEPLPRFAHAEPLSGGGCGAWFTLMSGETCTGGTILSVTLAPEAQFGPERTPQGPEHRGDADAEARPGVRTQGDVIRRGARRLRMRSGRAASARSLQQVRPSCPLTFSNHGEHKSRPAHLGYKYLKSVSTLYKVRNRALSCLSRPARGSSHTQACPGRGPPRPAPGTNREGARGLDRQSGVRVQSVA